MADETIEKLISEIETVFESGNDEEIIKFADALVNAYAEKVLASLSPMRCSVSPYVYLGLLAAADCVGSTFPPEDREHLDKIAAKTKRIHMIVPHVE